MAKCPPLLFVTIFSVLAIKVFCQELDLLDAFDDIVDKTSTMKPNPGATGGGAGGGAGGAGGRSPGAPSEDLNIWDALDEMEDETPTMKPNPGPTRGGTGGAGGGRSGDGMKTITKAPVRPKPKPAADGFDLSDALDPKNDIGEKRKNDRGGQFTDDDLSSIADGGGYVPDNGRAGGRPSTVDSADDATSDTTMESGTIAGIVSALAMTIVGAAGSYISYQKKRLCFSVQENLNAAYMKGENPEDVV
ncbi:CD99 antigen-like protein 2 isoform X1 [Brienomyrus brachyistius]|uniref:CD99 antigen-like protein 2 isoform X1 n=1 Tax=Brienomyrus brachyistius TaxID=42636 RepID=UPI0020B2E291|nr:CD99 antigen-like protein 2 isoform X1 [Brienomyrus brachyistius]XP_048851088.1 CD99 antigen-like protein 2 isoform X1 [Brienomyrus brachyistius]